MGLEGIAGKVAVVTSGARAIGAAKGLTFDGGYTAR